jgi:hypothetical protein
MTDNVLTARARRLHHELLAAQTRFESLKIAIDTSSATNAIVRDNLDTLKDNISNAIDSLAEIIKIIK